MSSLWPVSSPSCAINAVKIRVLGRSRGCQVISSFQRLTSTRRRCFRSLLLPGWLGRGGSASIAEWEENLLIPIGTMHEENQWVLTESSDYVFNK